MLRGVFNSQEVHMIRNLAMILQRMINNKVNCAATDTHNSGFVEVSEVEPQVIGQLRRQNQRMYSWCERAQRSCQLGQFLGKNVRAFLERIQLLVP